MIVECENCGAPLDVKSGATFVDCDFCQLSNKVAKTRTLMVVTPANWQPPVQWTEADRAAAAKAAMGTAAVAATTTGLMSIVVIGIAVVTVAAIGIVIAVVVFDAAGSGSAPAPIFAEPAWDGTTPFRCGGNDQVTIEGVTANLPNDVAITASVNCSVTIIDSTINARAGIAASGNAAIELRRTTINATETGADLALNNQLTLDGSQIVAGGVGVDAKMNSRIQLNSGTIEGSPAVTTQMNATLTNVAGEIVDR